jgi:hypothetical protein
MTEVSANQPALDHDVFVSYASQDAVVANSIVENLEQHGCKCWIAPRDVKPGAQYADAIVRAINEARALVLARRITLRFCFAVIRTPVSITDSIA